MTTMPVKIALASAWMALEAAGYTPRAASDDSYLILAVTSGGDKDESLAILETIRDVVGADFSVEYTGSGSTDQGDGITTEEVRIEVPEALAQNPARLQLAAARGTIARYRELVQLGRSRTMAARELGFTLRGIERLIRATKADT